MEPYDQENPTPPNEAPIPHGGDLPEDHLPGNAGDGAQDAAPEAPPEIGPNDLRDPDGGQYDEDPGQGYADPQGQEQSQGMEQGPEQGQEAGQGDFNEEQMAELEQYLESLPPEEQEALLNELMESQQGGEPEGDYPPG